MKTVGEIRIGCLLLEVSAAIQSKLQLFMSYFNKVLKSIEFLITKDDLFCCGIVEEMF